MENGERREREREAGQDWDGDEDLASAACSQLKSVNNKRERGANWLKELLDLLKLKTLPASASVSACWRKLRLCEVRIL